MKVQCASDDCTHRLARVDLHCQCFERGTKQDSCAEDASRPTKVKRLLNQLTKAPRRRFSKQEDSPRRLPLVNDGVASKQPAYRDLLAERSSQLRKVGL